MVASVGPSQVRDLNRLGRRYGVDVYVTMMDAVNIFRDAEFTVPAVAWLPYHFADLTPPDRHVTH